MTALSVNSSGFVAPLWRIPPQLRDGGIRQSATLNRFLPEGMCHALWLFRPTRCRDDDHRFISALIQQHRMRQIMQMIKCGTVHRRATLYEIAYCHLVGNEVRKECRKCITPP